MSLAFTVLILVGRIGTASQPSLQRAKNAIRLETLADEIAEQSLEDAIVERAGPAAKPASDRRIEECIGIDVLERFGDGAVGNGAADARRFYFLPHAELATAARERLRPRNGFGDPLIVQRALRTKLFDRLLDRVGLVPAARQPLADLRFRELTPREHLEGVEVGGRHQLIVL